MFHRQAQQLQFIHQFVDAVTVRPFLDDLRRIKRAASVFRSLPRVIQDQEEAANSSTEAA